MNAPPPMVARPQSYFEVGQWQATPEQIDELQRRIAAACNLPRAILFGEPADG